MKKIIKVFLIIFMVLVIFVLVDTIQARFLNNRPILKITDTVETENLFTIPYYSIFID